MRLTINKSVATGKIVAPPSKSYAHRLLIAAAFTNEATVVKNIVMSNDIIATTNCLRTLGYKLEYNIQNKEMYISKENKELPNTLIFDAMESGSTLRFMIPIALTTGKRLIFKGSPRLIERGIDTYIELFEKQDIKIEKNIDNIIITGLLKPGIFKIKNTISSQYITGLLFATSLLNGDSTIFIPEDLASKSYIDITIDVLNKANIKIEETKTSYFIKGNQKYINNNFFVEGDYSNAAFIDALNYLGGNVEIEGLNEKSLQGDKVYKEYFDKLSKGYEKIDLSNCIDLGPILFGFSGLFYGGHFINTSRLKLKESNRVEDVKIELEKLGIEVIDLGNEVIVKNDNLHSPSEILKGHKDHRIIMMLSVLLTKLSGTIENTEDVSKSYPNFFIDLMNLGIEVKNEEK